MPRQGKAQARPGNTNALGYRHTPEELAAISAATKARWADPEYRARQRAARRRRDSGYEAAHDRVRLDRGVAKDHGCISCGDPAAHWALNHERAQDVRAQAEGQYMGLPYSLDPMDYDPRCVRCHKRYDLDRDTP